MYKRKFKKRKNGSGSIVKLSGKRRKPFAVKVTDGFDEITHMQKQKVLETFETYPEAETFLNMYNLMKDKQRVSDDQARMINEDVYDQVKYVEQKGKEIPTFKEIFEILCEEKFKYQKSYGSKISWFNNFKSLHTRKINNINLHDLQEIFDDLKSKGRKSGTLSHMKILAMDIFEYAVIHQYIKRDDDYTSYINIAILDKEENNDSKKDNEKERRIPLTINQIREIMKMDSLSAKYTLLYVFTGCRPIELLDIDTSKIFIDVECDDDGQKEIVSYMITGSKSDAGRNRIIPIHDNIKPIIQELLDKHPAYLIAKDINNPCQWFLHNHFEPLMKELNLDRTTYACRHTFSTLAKQYKIDSFARKRIMGHKSNDITDDVYTHIIINTLYKEIHKIKL